MPTSADQILPLPHKNTNGLPPRTNDARILAARYFPEFNMQDKVVVVTGGGRGLGLTMAEALFQGGAIGMSRTN